MSGAGRASWPTGAIESAGGERFSTIAVGDDEACGVRQTDDWIQCWTFYPTIVPPGSYNVSDGYP